MRGMEPTLSTILNVALLVVCIAVFPVIVFYVRKLRYERNKAISFYFSHTGIIFLLAAPLMLQLWGREMAVASLGVGIVCMLVGERVERRTEPNSADGSSGGE